MAPRPGGRGAGAGPCVRGGTQPGCWLGAPTCVAASWLREPTVKDGSSRQQGHHSCHTDHIMAWHHMQQAVA